MPTRGSTPLTRILWALAIANVVVAAVLWLRHDAPPDEVDDPGEPPDYVLLSDDEVKGVVAAPPVDGPVDLVALDLAIERGTEAYLESYVRPWLERAEAGGVLEYPTADGGTDQLGPDVYVQCGLYLLIHLLMYEGELEIGRDHPLVQRTLAWMLDTFDANEGRWIWSDEGCMQPKAMIALARLDEMETFESAWTWAKGSPIFQECTRPDLCSILRSGRIVQTLGPADLSLSGRYEWEHGTPVPDEENAAKYAYALLQAGRHPDSPEVASLLSATAQFIAETHRPLGQMNTKDLLGRAWLVLLHQRFRLPPNDGYRASLATMRAAMRGEWRKNFLLRSIPLFRALFVRALVEAGERSPELDAVVHGLVEAQTDQGDWRVPHVASVWSLGPPPAEGFKYGNMNGANTYMVTLALATYRRHRH